MSSAARYMPRAPRYVFRPEDERLMRFAEMDTRGSTSRARVHDLSTTGLSFICDGDAVPFEGDMLKVEFGLPGSKQIAWFATVMRIESRREWDPELGDRIYTLIALKFRELPPAFYRAIEKSVGNYDQAGKSHEDQAVFTSPKAEGLATLAFLSFAVVACMALMALPPEIWLKPFRI
jgi:hypothetical protein